jgi:hypothetical protein
MATQAPPPDGWQIDALAPEDVDIETIDAFHLGGDRFSASFELSNDRSEYARSFLLDVRFGETLTFDIRLRIEDSIKSHTSLGPDQHLVLELGGIIHELQPEGDNQVSLPQGMLRRLWSLDGRHQYAIGNRGIGYIREGGDWQVLSPYGDSYLKSIHGRSPQNVYACGSQGELLQLEGREWVSLDLPIQANFNDIHIDQKDSIFLAGFAGNCFEIRDMELIPLANEGFDYMGIAEFKGHRYWSDANFGVSIQRDDRIEPFRAIGQGFTMHSSPDLLVIAGWKEVFVFDGEDWSGFELGYDGNIFLSQLDMTQFGG